MERLISITSLTTTLVGLSKPGDTIQLRVQDNKMAMLNEVDGVDPATVEKAYQTYSGKLSVAGVEPSLWLINDSQPLGEAIYNYPELRLTLIYNIDGKTITLNSDRSIALNIESETIRLKASRFEESYLDLLFSERSAEVMDLLSNHGLKIKDLDTKSNHISSIGLEPRT